VTVPAATAAAAAAAAALRLPLPLPLPLLALLLPLKAETLSSRRGVLASQRVATALLGVSAPTVTADSACRSSHVAAVERGPWRCRRMMAVQLFVTRNALTNRNPRAFMISRSKGVGYKIRLYLCNLLSV
jgi:hypothetical protein